MNTKIHPVTSSEPVTNWRGLIGLLSGLFAFLAVVLFVLVDGFIRFEHSLNVQVLTIPYAVAGVGLSLVLPEAITAGAWLHVVLFVVGLFVLCALV